MAGSATLPFQLLTLPATAMMMKSLHAVRMLLSEWLPQVAKHAEGTRLQSCSRGANNMRTRLIAETEHGMRCIAPFLSQDAAVKSDAGPMHGSWSVCGQGTQPHLSRK